MFANTQMMGKDPKRPGRGGERSRAEEPADEEVTGGLAAPGARTPAPADLESAGEDLKTASMQDDAPDSESGALSAPGPNAMTLNFEEFKVSGSSLLGGEASNFTLEGNGTGVNIEEIELAFDSDDHDPAIAAELTLEDI